MHFIVDVPYANLSPAQCLELHRNDDFQNTIAAAADTHRQPLSYQPVGQVGFRRVAEFIFQRDVGNTLSRWFNAVRPTLGYLEESTYVGPQGGTWSINGNRPAHLAGRIHGAGTLKFIAYGPHTIRRVEGDIHVDVPVVRSYAESKIVKELSLSLQKAAAYVPTWLRTHRLPPPPPLTLADDII